MHCDSKPAGEGLTGLLLDWKDVGMQQLTELWLKFEWKLDSEEISIGLDIV